MLPRGESRVRAEGYHQDAAKRGEGTVAEVAQENLRTSLLLFSHFCLKLTGGKRDS